MIENLSI